jgi:NADH:ubiquinone reductase (H+-translocating)
MTPDSRPTVVVVGAGFGGLAVVKSLRRAPVQTALVDQNNYHLFAPLLYQVATALLDPSEIATPVRAIVGPIANAEFHLGRVEEIDLEARTVTTGDENIAYDYLVVATGSRTNFFGNPNLKARSVGLKDMDDALSMRSRVLELFEKAKWETDESRHKRLLTFVVVGGGPTGIETAGALIELIHFNLRKDFKEMDLSEVEVRLVEGSDHLLGPFHPRLQESAIRTLERKGVRVQLETRVRDVRDGEVEFSDGTVIPCGLVIWTAGVCASEVSGLMNSELGGGGRVPVESTLQLPGHPEVFVIGDLAQFSDGGEVLPMLAPVAQQAGRCAADNIAAMVEGRSLKDFHYRDRGIMSTIGRSAAVAQVGRFRIGGFIGWLVWMGVHLLQIGSFRTQATIVVNWAWNYVSNDRPARTILRADAKGDGIG